MPSFFDTIAAPITGTENAAVAVIRLSGPESWAIASKVFWPWPDEVRPRFALYGAFATGDDGLCLPFEEGHSYTGEMSVELSIHGSRAAVAGLVESCLNAGARMARPGEFTERAFLNGRIDLTQAEGVRDTVEALTRAQLKQANLLREGALKESVSKMRRGVTSVLARIEASVDFSEEIGELDKEQAIRDLGEASSDIDGLLRTAEAGRILRRGRRIAIVGPPNAGKSSLLNALLGFDRAIVTDVPGTTRDFVEERIDLGGIPCVLTDTAGLRETDQEIERIGIDLARKAAEAADEVWYVFDGSAGWTHEDDAALAQIGGFQRILANKADLFDGRNGLPEAAHSISAKTLAGLDRLVELVSSPLKTGPTLETVWINDRHGPLLLEAKAALQEAAGTLQQDLPVDLASVHLHAALNALAQITGETASEDMLEQIFRDFCIGK